MYETGALVALFLICASNLFSIMRHYSLQSKNLKKIGMRLGWLDGKPKENDQSGIVFKLIKIVLFLISSLIAVGLSWITVISMIAALTFNVWKDFDPPERIKNIRWKMKNINMSEDEVLKGMFEATGLPESAYSGFVEDHRNLYGEFYNKH